MTTFDRYDHLPEPIRKAFAELEDFIGDLDGKTMGTEASDGEGFIDEGTVDADDAVKAFNVLVSALPAQEWQDISTAPKDGAEVIVWTSEGMDIARYSDGEPDGSDSMGHDAGWWGLNTPMDPGRHMGNPEYFREPECQPTHWLPIKPPASLDEEEDGTLIADDRGA